MAAITAAPSHAFLAAFLPVARSTLAAQAPARTTLTPRLPLWQRIESALIPAAFLPIPNVIGALWDGLLRAVPKKKTSHMKKRHRQMAGKALKDVTALTKCSGCGRIKRAHVLCPYCVQSIQMWMRNGFKSEKQIAEAKEQEESLNKAPQNEEEKVSSFDLDTGGIGKDPLQSQPSRV